MAKWMIAIGAGLALVGVAVNFWFEWQAGLREIPLTQLEYVPFVTLLAYIGPPVALIGSIKWASTGVSRRPLTILGYILVGCSLVGPMLTGVNIHDWTVTLVCVYAAALLIGVVFIALAFNQKA